MPAAYLEKHHYGGLVMASSLTLSLTKELRHFIDSQVGDNGVYSTPSEYVRDVIRRDRERLADYEAEKRIMAGVKDLAAGDFVEVDRDDLLSNL